MVFNQASLRKQTTNQKWTVQKEMQGLHLERQWKRRIDEWMGDKRMKETKKETRKIEGKGNKKMKTKSCQISNRCSSALRNIPFDNLNNDDWIYQKLCLSWNVTVLFSSKSNNISPVSEHVLTIASGHYCCQHWTWSVRCLLYTTSTLIRTTLTFWRRIFFFKF